MEKNIKKKGFFTHKKLKDLENKTDLKIQIQNYLNRSNFQIKSYSKTNKVNNYNNYKTIKKLIKKKECHKILNFIYLYYKHFS